jgi:hypothetical protein
LCTFHKVICYLVLHVNCCFLVLHFVPRMLQSCFFHQVGMLFVFGNRWICVFSMTKEDEFYIIEIVSKVDQDASIDPLKCSFFQFQKLKKCICNLCTLATCKMLIFVTCMHTNTSYILETSYSNVYLLGFPCHQWHFACKINEPTNVVMHHSYIGTNNWQCFDAKIYSHEGFH